MENVEKKMGFYQFIYKIYREDITVVSVDKEEFKKIESLDYLHGNKTLENLWYRKTFEFLYKIVGSKAYVTFEQWDFASISDVYEYIDDFIFQSTPKENHLNNIKNIDISAYLPLDSVKIPLEELSCMEHNVVKSGENSYINNFGTLSKIIWKKIKNRYYYTEILPESLCALFLSNERYDDNYDEEDRILLEKLSEKIDYAI